MTQLSKFSRNTFISFTKGFIMAIDRRDEIILDCFDMTSRFKFRSIPLAFFDVSIRFKTSSEMEDFYDTIIEMNNEDIPYYLKHPRIKFLNEERLIDIFITKFDCNTSLLHVSNSYYNFEEELIKHTFKRCSIEEAISDSIINYIPILRIYADEINDISQKITEFLSSRMMILKISKLEIVLSDNLIDNNLECIFSNPMIQVNQVNFEIKESKDKKNLYSKSSECICNINEIVISQSLTDSIRIIHWRLSSEYEEQELESFESLVLKLPNLHKLILDSILFSQKIFDCSLKLIHNMKHCKEFVIGNYDSRNYKPNATVCNNYIDIIQRHKSSYAMTRVKANKIIISFRIQGVSQDSVVTDSKYLNITEINTITFNRPAIHEIIDSFEPDIQNLESKSLIIQIPDRNIYEISLSKVISKYNLSSVVALDTRKNIKYDLSIVLSSEDLNKDKCVEDLSTLIKKVKLNCLSINSMIIDPIVFRNIVNKLHSVNKLEISVDTGEKLEILCDALSQNFCIKQLTVMVAEIDNRSNLIEKCKKRLIKESRNRSISFTKLLTWTINNS